MYEDAGEEGTVTLKDGIDLNELREHGALFEVEEPDLDKNAQEEATSNSYFPQEEVFHNLMDRDDETDTDDDDESSPFEKMTRKMVDISGDGGVMKKVLQEGSGNVLPSNALARVHYNAYLEYADEPFDSTRLRNKVLKFKVGEGEVIPGLDVAVATMKRGELSRFVFQSDYGFGHAGSPPRIPQDATLMFEVEVLNFVEHAGVDDYNFMTEEEKRNVSFEDIKKVHNSRRQEGKQMYDARQFKKAFSLYRNAADVLEKCHLKNEVEEREQQSSLLSTYLSMAVCCTKLCHSGRTITFCKQALEIDRNNTKALYLYGKALHQLSEFERARDYLLRAKQRAPQDKCINTELQKLEQDMQKFSIIEKNMYAKMFSKPKGQSDTERQISQEISQRAEDKCLQCSDEFRQIARKNLDNFLNDSDLMEMPWPAGNFSVAETECILETADELGLDVKLLGSGQNARMKIYKKKPESNVSD